MTTPSQTPHPTPERIFQSLNAFQLTAALKAAIELDFFTAIGTGADTASAIASRCHVAERGARILCDYLVVQGFLTKNVDRYALAPDSAAFLDRRSLMYVGSCMGFLASPSLMEHYRDFAAVVRKGGTTISEHGTIEENNPVWFDFARSMAALQTMPAELFADVVQAIPGTKSKVLDVAAGHGLFGLAVARRNPDAEIYAADWSNVLDVAAENAQNAGLSSRFHRIPGDAFKTDFGRDYDVVLLTNFLHHFDRHTIEAFLRKVHAAMKPGGRAVTLDFVPNDDRVSPPTPAAFAITMLATTPSGDVYTFTEYDRMFRGAGFAKSEFHALPITQSAIVSTK